MIEDFNMKPNLNLGRFEESQKRVKFNKLASYY